MKTIIACAGILLLCACQKDITPWEEHEGNRQAGLYLTTRSGSDAPASPYRLFLHNLATGETETHDIPEEESGGQPVLFKLFPGSYTAYAVSNATADSLWDFSRNDSIHEISLTAGKDKDNRKEPGDHALGSIPFQVQKDSTVSRTIHMERKVAKLKVRISNMPEEMDDLLIEVDNAAERMFLSGAYEGRHTILKPAGDRNASGISETVILLFPPVEPPATLALHSASRMFLTAPCPVDSILPNRITEVNADFLDMEIQEKVEFSTRVLDWNDTVISRDWQIVPPLPPCTGTGNGINLVTEGDFEGSHEDILRYWKYSNTDQDKPQRSRTDTLIVSHGRQSLAIEGKTYICRTIPVLSQECYTIQVLVNAPGETSRWKYTYRWYDGKKELLTWPIPGMDEYQKKTDGFIDPFGGRVFRAPTGADRLEIELKNYGDPGTDEIYIDHVRVEHVG